MAPIGARLLEEIAELPGHKLVLWSSGGTSHGHFEMSGGAIAGGADAKACVSALTLVCRAGGGVLVRCDAGRRKRDGRPVANVAGFGCSQSLFTRMAPEEVEWTVTHDPATFEPVRPPQVHIQYI